MTQHRPPLSRLPMTPRLYAYAVLFLRDVFHASPNNRYYEWKARTMMVASQAFLICAAAPGIGVRC